MVGKNCQGAEEAEGLEGCDTKDIVLQILLKKALMLCCIAADP
jgi:hypothetical protein